VASQRYLAERWDWHVATVNRFFARLEAEQMVQRRNVGKYSVIYVVNFAEHQPHANGRANGSANGRANGACNKTNKDITKKDTNKETIGRDATAPPKEPGKKTKRNLIFEDHHLNVAQRLAKRFQEHNPRFAPPKKLDAWANEVRLMFDRHGEPDVMAVFGYIFGRDDDFWRRTKASPAGIEKSWNTITAQMESDQWAPAKTAEEVPPWIDRASNPPVISGAYIESIVKKSYGDWHLKCLSQEYLSFEQWSEMTGEQYTTKNFSEWLEQHRTARPV